MNFTSYEQTIEYLYSNLPMFQRVGAAAYKEDLTNTIALCETLGNPQGKFKSVHVAGTNGKGSTSHMVASILQCAGYKTGLYTSPHLKEFTERIRINGKEIDRNFVVDFVNRIQSSIEQIQPSFFEITVAMAFDYFVREKADIAVIEVGLGGRLDSTNVVTPLVSIITNIGWDHKDLLGDTLEKIAAEKGGIIKPSVPVVISQRQRNVENVFLEISHRLKSPLSFADENYRARLEGQKLKVLTDEEQLFSIGDFPLPGIYQEKNIPGVLRAVDELRKVGFRIDNQAVRDGLRDVVKLTGLKGRWQKIGEKPLIICDTAHNTDGISEVVKQLRREKYKNLLMVIGMVKDKDISDVLSILPKEADYYFCQAKIPRALEAELLAEKARAVGLSGKVVTDVNEAIRQAKAEATSDDLIFVGGSTFVVAEVEEL